MLGKIEGRRRRGQQRMRWLDSITDLIEFEQTPGDRGFPGAPQGVLVVKDPPANAGDIRDAGLIPGSGRFSGGGNSNPLQYSFLENPMNRGAWGATVHGVTKNRTLCRVHHTKCWAA